MDAAGSCETAAALWWRLIAKYRPDTRVVVVRRPVEEVLDSLMRVPGTAFDAAKVRAVLIRQDRALDLVAKRALTVRYDGLATEETCRTVFEHCLPYSHDSARWAEMNGRNLQCDLPALLRYSTAHRPQLARAAWLATRTVRRNRRMFSMEGRGGVKIQEESFDVFFRDAQLLAAEHLVAIGETPDNWNNKNLAFMRQIEDGGAWSIVTARLNGRMLGYLMTVLTPSLEQSEAPVAVQTAFFASQDAKGMNLGMQLQRASIEAVRARGVRDIVMRAGVRGAGPRMGVLYQRLGAVDDGHMYRLNLKAA